MSLSVKILSDTEFDSLPYPEAKISLGLADTKSGQAYVRYTANEELNKYLINHELEHLLGEDRDEIHHGGNGVYYKGFGNLFSGLGQMFQGAGQSVAGAADTIGRSAQGAGKSIMGMFGGGQGAPKPIDVAPKGMAANAGRMGPQYSGQTPISMMPSAPMSSSAGPQVGRQSFQNPPTPNRITPPSNPNISMPQPMQSPRPQAGSSAQSPMSSFSLPIPSNAPAGTQTIRSSTGAPMSSIAPSMPNPSGSGAPAIIPTSRAGTPPSAPVATPSAGGSKDAMSMFGKNPAQTLMGAGLEGMGQFGIQTPNMPDINELPSVQALRQFNFNSVGELDPALEQAINNDFQRIEDKETQDMIARYKSLRPGADIESDSNFKRDLIELQRMQGQRREDAMAKYRFQMIQQNLQMSQAELAQMQDMAQMDIQMIMGQMGLDYADAQKFKDTFSRLGDTMITQGLGIGQEEEAPVEQPA